MESEKEGARNRPYLSCTRDANERSRTIGESPGTSMMYIIHAAATHLVLGFISFVQLIRLPGSVVY
jgi:hypothetical protein